MADVKMKSTKGSHGCTIDGKSYYAVNGFVIIPEQHAKMMESHGFALHKEEDKPEDDKKAPSKK